MSLLGEKPVKFIDSNVLIYAFYDNPFQDNCRNCIRQGGITNALNLAEFLTILENKTNRTLAMSALKGLLRSNVKIVEVDVNVIFEALKRSNNLRLDFFDLIHYATAILNDCESILSYDKDFDKLEIKREEP